MSWQNGRDPENNTHSFAVTRFQTTVVLCSDMCQKGAPKNEKKIYGIGRWIPNGILVTVGNKACCMKSGCDGQA